MKSGLLYIFLSVLLSTKFASIVQVDKTVHDWGDVTVNDGPLNCTFTITNISNKPQTIRRVLKTCGCTKVSWSTKPLNPGEEGFINVTYSNDEGPYPFDKTLNVYFDGVKKPLLLHIRADVHKVKLPIAQTYPIHFKGLGVKSTDIKVGNLLQGEQKSNEFTVANVSQTPIVLGWTDLDPQLGIEPRNQTIEPESTARVVVTVNANRARWGKNHYIATAVVNGEKADWHIDFTAVTIENFSNWTQKQRDDAPKAEVETTMDTSPVKRGENMNAAFEVSNVGKSPLIIYKADYDNDIIKSLDSCNTIESGTSQIFRYEINTSGLKQDSENTLVITLYTNDPTHPMLHFYIDAIIL